MRKFFRVLMPLVVVPTLLAACATPKGVSEARIGSFPSMGTPTTVTVGEEMVYKFDYIARPVAVLREELSGSWWHGRNALPVGATLQKMTVSDTTVFCTEALSPRSACLEDRNGDGYFDRAYSVTGLGTLNTPGASIDDVAYSLDDAMGPTGFRYELVYQGRSDNVIRVAYREYSGTLARPAFHQDLSYTLEGGQGEIAFRDLRIDVHEATNNAITFTVLRGL